MDNNNYRKAQANYMFCSDSSYIEKLRTTQLQSFQSKKYCEKNFNYILARASIK